MSLRSSTSFKAMLISTVSFRPKADYLPLSESVQKSRSSLRLASICIVHCRVSPKPWQVSPRWRLTLEGLTRWCPENRPCHGFDAILTSGQTGEKLQCLYENRPLALRGHMTNASLNVGLESC